MGKDKRVFNLLLVIGLLFVSHANSFALSAKGYIVTLQSDTVYGWVQVGRFDQTTGGFLLNGIETASYSWRVVFATKEEKRYKTYFPETILGFGFVYKSEEYIYERTEVKRKSIFKNEGLQYRFVRITGKDKCLKTRLQPSQQRVDSVKQAGKNNLPEVITK
jgi:hypothetical protein